MAPSPGPRGLSHVVSARHCLGAETLPRPPGPGRGGHEEGPWPSVTEASSHRSGSCCTQALCLRNSLWAFLGESRGGSQERGEEAVGEFLANAGGVAVTTPNSPTSLTGFRDWTPVAAAHARAVGPKGQLSEVPRLRSSLCLSRTSDGVTWSGPLLDGGVMGLDLGDRRTSFSQLETGQLLSLAPVGFRLSLCARRSTVPEGLALWGFATCC